MKLRILGAIIACFGTMACSSASPLVVGDEAPKVSAVTDENKTIQLGDVYARHTYTLVYFYPKAGTAGCTAQGCSLRDAYEELTDRGVAVVGVSSDTVAEQRAFKAAQHYPFPLIADTDQKVMKAFGVPSYPGSKAARRQAFLIRDGKIVWADYTASTTQQAADVLKAIASL